MKKLIFALSFVFALISCQAPTENATKQEIPGNLKHIVFFWLKNPDNTADRATFETALRKLMYENKQAVATYLGTPAPTEKRDVVDHSYTYCFMITFPSLAAQDTYQSDQTHLTFIDEASHLWDKVLVYDTVP